MVEDYLFANYKMRFLNNKEVKRLWKELKETHPTMRFSNKHVFIEDNKNIFVVSENIKNIDINALNIKSIGLKFIAYHDKKSRITPETIQLFSK